MTRLETEVVFVIRKFEKNTYICSWGGCTTPAVSLVASPPSLGLPYCAVICCIVIVLVVEMEMELELDGAGAALPPYFCGDKTMSE